MSYRQDILFINWLKGSLSQDQPITTDFITRQSAKNQKNSNKADSETGEIVIKALFTDFKDSLKQGRLWSIGD